MEYHLAVDIGASSGRHILGHVEQGRMVLEEIYRFGNTQVWRNGHDCWDLETLWAHILAGLQACKAAGKIPATLGIDTWAVDFVLLDGEGRPVGDAVAYRDGRTAGLREMLEPALPFARHYARTGIQYQPFNTAYQLAALQREAPGQLAAAAHFLMIPEYFNYRLTGKIKNEYTNATTTALVNAESKTWDDEVIAALGLPRAIFGPLHLPGETVGRFTSEVRAAVGFDCTVVLPATHDTGSAFLAVPARDENAVTLSSGTWSLLGVENETPITTPQSLAQNFTNEGGYQYRFRYLKNIMGLWMIQSIRRELNGEAYVTGKASTEAAGSAYTYAQLEAEARANADFPGRVDVDAPRFLAPDSMSAEVRAACAENGGPVPENVGELMACVYHSLAESYRRAVDALSGLTGKRYTSINLVGGGSKDEYLNELTAKATGLTVYAGPTEGTALGNLMVQFLNVGAFADLRAARAAIRDSFEIKEVRP